MSFTARIALLTLACAFYATASVAAAPAPIDDRLPQDEVIYFLLPDRFANGSDANDRGGIAGDRLQHGFDPDDKGFFHGGDFQGVMNRLDYIQGMGVTAIWLSPIFENKAVQTFGEYASAGYHGYWVTDFLNVDPHLGTREEFRAFVDAAHERGMKVYMDIITNHTADVIKYRECENQRWDGAGPAEGCDYRALGDYPWTTIGSPDGEAINAGFLGDEPAYLTPENFAKLDNPNWAYTPYVPDAEKKSKNPAWLNDLIYYNNRGNTRWEGENSIYGDFSGLDDLMTQHPRVVEGMIDIYKQWITDFRIDGYRVDTTRHVNVEFWQEFTPAIIAHAESLGIDHFHVFGEVFEPDPGQLARWVNEAKIPSVLDFGFQDAAAAYLVRGESARVMERFIHEDQAYAGGHDTAAFLPTFLGNHDMGRYAGFLRDKFPEADDAEMLARVRLAHALMMFSRGVPTIYYGDEQGFVSDAGDQDARETLFPSHIDIYNDNDLIGTDATTAGENFDVEHPLYKAFAEMAAARHANPALRRGIQVTRHSDLEGELYVFSRLHEDSGEEIVVAINNDTAPRRFNARVDGRSTEWTTVLGTCADRSAATGSYPIEVGALDFVVCRSVRR
ncbi:MAG: alpha-amylase family glycosyl hydrolase [Pseudomonadota bacterium]